MGNPRLSPTGRAICTAALAAVLAASGRSARADLEVRVGNGDKVTGTLSPADEAETLRFVVPTGALISVTTKGIKPKGGTAPAVGFAMLDPDGVAVGATATVVKGTGAKLKKFGAEKPGEYRVVVTGDATAGDYTATVSWTSPRTYRLIGTLTGVDATYDFDAETGATARFVAKAGKGAALPRLVELRDAAGVFHTFTPPASASAKSHSEKNVALGATRALRLVIGDAGTGGPFTATISVKARKPSKRKIALTSDELPALDGGAVAALFSRDGGFLAVDDMPVIAGSSVSIPAGAVASPVAVFIGAAPAVDPADATVAAGGPAVFFGPEGLQFLPGLEAQVTIPFDASAFPGGTSALHVYTRDAAGAVTEITPVTANVAQHTCTFATSHFSSFQAFAAPVTGPTQLAKLTVVGAQPNDNFGFWCSLDGPRAIVGALVGDAPGAADVGVAHVYRDEGAGSWPPEAQFAAPSPVFGERFAECVAISGDVAVVGASMTNTLASESGTVFVYERTGTTWGPALPLKASDPIANGHFGKVVAISGDTIVVGCFLAQNGSGVTTGAVYVFRRGVSTWEEEQKIVPADATFFVGIGSSVAIEGDTLLFGQAAFTASPPDTGAGAVYVYTRSGTTWSLQQKLEADVPATSDSFGEFSVALSGDTAVVATPRSGQIPQVAPEVYVFTRTAGVWSKQTIVSSGSALERFGNSVAVSGDRMIVGLPGSIDGAGAVFVYRRTGTQWSAPTTLVPDDAGPDQNFGSSVSMTATRFLVGSVAENGFTGSAYVFFAGP